ncbi:glutathione S-transferase [Nitrosomonas aestuarii]|nr:glutathione S-transferase [Nitrosomonas aestuarii]
MLKLYQFNRTWGIPNLSPFCCKVETYLRMADIDYDIVAALPPGAPKRKLPYIDDSGKIVADSHFILTHLRSTYQDLDKDLDSTQRATSLAWQHLLEDHLFWSFFYFRWMYTDDNWKINRKAIFGELPPVIQNIVALHTRSKIKRQIIGQGMGRHQTEEITLLGKQDIDALSDFLGNQPFFFGNQPTSLDASAYGMLINIIGCPIESPLKEHGLTKENLRNYVNRISLTYYADLSQA